MAAATFFAPDPHGDATIEVNSGGSRSRISRSTGMTRRPNPEPITTSARNIDIWEEMLFIVPDSIRFARIESRSDNQGWSVLPYSRGGCTSRVLNLFALCCPIFGLWRWCGQLDDIKDGVVMAGAVLG
ncbi:hypothetical protein CIHG_02133 [Coccidioides immitis H538.4]|uniref:Uncharacterized protein n=3 Tax=Coccidioides immitis TaxID=5501 RepID=A0A0J8RBG1_COCIT|nr:hypothetical protein CIRG_00305 [Coccidioides immitis RMSCC 2394]KMU81750.1 hypothetical protein CISG_02768 [Coccidioides immitis RMSCC 3703]KMU84347.1 hypothetical protein CIHG_02133 [Coccidioides immitis H538.4]